MFRCDGMDDHLAHQALRFIEWRRRSLESFAQDYRLWCDVHGLTDEDQALFYHLIVRAGKGNLLARERAVKEGE